MKVHGMLLYEDCHHRWWRRIWPWHPSAHAIAYLDPVLRELGPDELPDGDTVTVYWDSKGYLHLFEKVDE